MFSLTLLSFLFVIYSDVVFAKTCEKQSDCIYFMDCDHARQLAETKRNQETRQKFVESFCGMSSRKLKICCSEFNPEPAPQFSSIDSRLLIIETETDDLSKEGVEENEGAHPNLPLLPENCGDLYEFRIVGGETASLYEFPWMALISYVTENNGLRFECAGSVINKRYILTAAHCVENKDIAGVRIGEYDIRYEEDCQGNRCESNLQDIPLEDKFVHHKYEGSPGFDNDIALLRLKKDIDFSFRNADPICLPVSNDLRNGSIVGKKATVAGWGVTEQNTEAARLLKVRIPVHSQEACQDYYSHLIDPAPMRFCAGIHRKDSCKGDSGGPLMIEDTYKGATKFVQFGIVSIGPMRCGIQSPGIYTDVRKYVDWILDTIKE